MESGHACVSVPDTVPLSPRGVETEWAKLPVVLALTRLEEQMSAVHARRGSTKAAQKRSHVTHAVVVGSPILRAPQPASLARPIISVLFLLKHQNHVPGALPVKWNVWPAQRAGSGPLPEAVTNAVLVSTAWKRTQHIARLVPPAVRVSLLIHLRSHAVPETLLSITRRA